MPLAAVLGISISQVLRDLGYLGLGLLLFVETVFPPIPSEAILPLAGYLVERGELAFVGVVAASTLGAVLGSMLLYEAARHGGRPFATRFLKIARVAPEKLDDAETWFAKRGVWVVLFGRCVPGVRSIVSVPAGLLRMPRATYVLLTALGSVVWNTLLVGAGYLLGTQWERVSTFVGTASTPLLAVAVLAAVGVLVWWLARHRQPAAHER